MKKKFYKNRNFLLLLSTNIFSCIGDSVDNIIILLLTIKLTNSAKLTGIMLMITSLPGVIMSIIGGVFSDAFSRKKIMMSMIGIQIVSISILLCCTIVSKNSFFLLCAILFLLECCSRFYEPAFSAATVNVVDKEDYQQSKSLLTTITSIVTMISTSACTALVSFAGYVVTIIVNLVSYILSFFMVSKVHIEPVAIIENNTNTQNIKTNFISMLKDGFAYIKKNKAIKSFIIILMLINFGLAQFDVTMPFFISDVLNLKIEYLGIMKTMSTFAFIIAGIVNIRHKFKNQIKTILVSLFLMGISFVILGFSKNFYIVATCWALGAFFRTILAIIMLSNIAVLCDNSLLGRVLGIRTMFSYIIVMISRGISGLLVETLGANIVFIASGLIFIVLTIMLLSRKSFRNLNLTVTNN